MVIAKEFVAYVLQKIYIFKLIIVISTNIHSFY